MTEETKVCPFRRGYCTNQCVFYDKGGVFLPSYGTSVKMVKCEILAWMLRQ